MKDSWITPEEREAVRQYLEKPAYSRDIDDLIPEDDETDD